MPQNYGYQHRPFSRPEEREQRQRFRTQRDRGQEWEQEQGSESEWDPRRFSESNDKEEGGRSRGGYGREEQSQNYGRGSMQRGIGRHEYGGSRYGQYSGSGGRSSDEERSHTGQYRGENPYREDQYSDARRLYGDWRGEGAQRQGTSFRGRGPKGYERSDERLKEIICERLTDDPEIDASNITIEVQNHEVTLQGNVEDRHTKYQVEELVEQCGGVRDIHNHLRVGSAGAESQTESKARPKM